MTSIFFKPSRHVAAQTEPGAKTPGGLAGDATGIFANRRTPAVTNGSLQAMN